MARGNNTRNVEKRSGIRKVSDAETLNKSLGAKRGTPGTAKLRNTSKAAAEKGGVARPAKVRRAAAAEQSVGTRGRPDRRHKG